MIVIMIMIMIAMYLYYSAAIASSSIILLSLHPLFCCYRFIHYFVAIASSIILLLSLHPLFCCYRFSHYSAITASIIMLLLLHPSFRPLVVQGKDYCFIHYFAASFIILQSLYSLVRYRSFLFLVFIYNYDFTHWNQDSYINNIIYESL
jgi:hypothetical protein